MHLAPIDYLPILLYLSMLSILGWRAWRKTDASNTGDFLLGKRMLTLPAFVATLVTTWYGGILGVGEFTYLYGISSWIVFGLPYYIFAILFALFLAKRIRAGEQYSVADRFYEFYGKKSGALASVFLLFMTSPAPYILMLALLLQFLFGISFIPALITGTLFSVIYVYFGGFRSVVNTDKMQFVLIYLGFALLLVYLIQNYGSPLEMWNSLPDDHRLWHGGNSTQVIVVWFFLASWTFIDPGFHQRCAAAVNGKVAQKGILLSIGFWFIFDFLTVTCGLYAVAMLSGIDPVMSYPLLAENVLPPFIKGIFLTALLAVIMSTIDSYTFLSAISFGRDLFWRLKPQIGEQSVNKYTRYGLIITALVSIALAVLFPSVIKLWYAIGSLFIPPMLLPLLATYFLRWQLSARYTFLIMSASFGLSCGWFLAGLINGTVGIPQYPFGLEPFFPGLVLSVIGYTSGMVFRRELTAE